MAEKVLSCSRQPTGFLDLPLELRIQVYQYCLVRKKTVNVDFIWIDPYRFSNWGICDESKSLLLVSKMVGSEALEVLYSENTFLVCLNGHLGNTLVKEFAGRNIQRIRRMHLVMRPCGISYGKLLDPTLWSPLLANLTKLTIMAQQPLVARTYYDAPPFEKELKEWTDWTTAVLQYIGRRLPTTCTIEVDDDDKQETSTLMKEHFPQGYQKVHTRLGDIAFSREERDDWYEYNGPYDG